MTTTAATDSEAFMVGPARRRSVRSMVVAPVVAAAVPTGTVASDLFGVAVWTSTTTGYPGHVVTPVTQARATGTVTMLGMPSRLVARSRHDVSYAQCACTKYSLFRLGHPRKPTVRTMALYSTGTSKQPGGFIFLTHFS